MSQCPDDEPAGDDLDERNPNVYSDGEVRDEGDHDHAAQQPDSCLK